MLIQNAHGTRTLLTDFKFIITFLRQNRYYIIINLRISLHTVDKHGSIHNNLYRYDNTRDNDHNLKSSKLDSIINYFRVYFKINIFWVVMYTL